MLTLKDSLFNWFDAPERIKTTPSRPQEATNIQMSELECEDQMDSIHSRSEIDGPIDDISPQTSPSSTKSAHLQGSDALCLQLAFPSPAQLDDSVPLDGWEVSDPPILVADNLDHLSRVNFDFFSPSTDLPPLTTGTGPEVQAQLWPLNKSDTDKQSASKPLSFGQSPKSGSGPFGIECPWTVLEEL